MKRDHDQEMRSLNTKIKILEDEKRKLTDNY